MAIITPFRREQKYRFDYGTLLSILLYPPAPPCVSLLLLVSVGYPAFPLALAAAFTPNTRHTAMCHVSANLCA